MNVLVDYIATHILDISLVLLFGTAIACTILVGNFSVSFSIRDRVLLLGTVLATIIVFTLNAGLLESLEDIRNPALTIPSPNPDILPEIISSNLGPEYIRQPYPFSYVEHIERYYAHSTYYKYVPVYTSPSYSDLCGSLNDMQEVFVLAYQNGYYFVYFIPSKMDYRFGWIPEEYLVPSNNDDNSFYNDMY